MPPIQIGSEKGDIMSHPSYGAAFIDASHAQDGFSYVGYPGAGRGFSGQESTPRYDDEDSEDDGDD
jgi:hypothetical protein